MLTLTKKTEYALIAVCHLANASDQVVSARDMARMYRVRLPLLMNVLKKLNQSGLLNSVRGARGGYTLAKPPTEISLSELIEGVEGSPKFVRCATAISKEDVPCDLLDSCPVRPPLVKIHGHFGRFLRGVSIADLAFDESYRGERGNGKKAPLKVIAQ